MAAPTRRAAPSPRGGAPAHAEPAVYDVGGTEVYGVEDDSWNLVGVTLRVPLSAWPDLAGQRGDDPCEVVALVTAGAHKNGYLLRGSDGELYSFALCDVRKLLSSARVAALKKSNLWRSAPRPTGRNGA